MSKPPKPVLKPPVPDADKVPSPPIPGENQPDPEPLKESPDDLAASVASSLKNSPAPNEAAIEAHAQRQNAENAENAANEAKPKRKYTPRGSKGGPAPFVQPGQGPDAKKEAYRQSGRAMADTLILVGQTLGGEDWKPNLVKGADGAILYDERGTLREAWADMAEEYQITRMPAWAACAIATAAYIGPRLNAPSTVSRWEKAKLWWAARKIKAADEAKAKAAAKEKV